MLKKRKSKKTRSSTLIIVIIQTIMIVALSLPSQQNELFSFSDFDEWIGYTTQDFCKENKQTKSEYISACGWTSRGQFRTKLCMFKKQDKSIFGLISSWNQRGKLAFYFPGLNMAKSRLLQKEREMTRIQIWQLALQHVSPNLRSQRDYRGAMSQHFNLTYSQTAPLSLSVWHTLSLLLWP